MLELSCSWAITLVIIFLIFLARAYYEDMKIDQSREQDRIKCPTCNVIGNLNCNTSEGFHSAVSATVQSELEHGVLAKSKVESLLNGARDQIIRGAIMGAIGGSAAEALHSAVTWSLVGGVVHGCGDLFKWHRT